MAKPIVVAGLGFGDEGKGTTVDAIVRRTGAKLVVRYNGGAQAAHNVVTPEGRHHTFSQFGSGTFAGAATLLSRYMMLNPISFMKEASAIVGHGLKPTVFIERDALITTPFHIATNRIKEMVRSNRHGSCGMGIGETMGDFVAGKDSIFVRDLEDPIALRRKLWQIMDRKSLEIAPLLSGMDIDPASALGREWAVFDPRFIDRTIAFYDDFGDLESEGLIEVVDETFLERALEGSHSVVFEGAQGVLLDHDHGFQPYTTWSDCTFNNAQKLLETRVDDAFYLGVLRAYHTRHGNGPFPTWNEEKFGACSANDHNKHGDWQGSFRSGAFDYVLAHYALEVAEGVDGLAITHLDRFDHVRGQVEVCVQYRDAEVWCDRIEVQRRPVDLKKQADLAVTLLEDVQPIYEKIDPYTFAETVSRGLDYPLAMKSSGPTWKDKTFLDVPF